MIKRLEDPHKNPKDLQGTTKDPPGLSKRLPGTPQGLHGDLQWLPRHSQPGTPRNPSGTPLMHPGTPPDPKDHSRPSPEIRRAVHAAFVELSASSQQPASRGEASEPVPAAFGRRQRRSSPDPHGAFPQHSAWLGGIRGAIEQLKTFGAI